VLWGVHNSIGAGNYARATGQKVALPGNNGGAFWMGVQGGYHFLTHYCD
jgi:hypothetical protein